MSSHLQSVSSSKSQSNSLATEKVSISSFEIRPFDWDSRENFIHKDITEARQNTAGIHYVKYSSYLEKKKHSL